MGKTYRVMVYGVRGEEMIIDLCNTDEQFRSMTVLQLKEKIAQGQPGHADGKDLCLASQGKLLDKDSHLLWKCGVQHKSVIYVIKKVYGGGPLPPDREDGGMGDKDGRNKNGKDLCLVSQGKLLDKDSRLLWKYGVQHKSVIDMILKVHGGGGGPLPPDREDGGMGDKDGRNKSMEKLSDFNVVLPDL